MWTPRFQSSSAKNCGKWVMILQLPLVFCLAMPWTGCHKRSKPAPAPLSSVSVTQEEAPVVPAGDAPLAPPLQPVVVSGSDQAAMLGQLTQALRKYCIENQRVPKTFEEFVASAAVQVPAPPAGKKFAIDLNGLHVVLVNR